MRSGVAFLLISGLLLSARPSFAQAADQGPNYETRMSALEEQLRTSNGQVEQLNYAIHRLDLSVQRMQADTDARLSRLEAAMAGQSAGSSQAVVQPQVAALPQQSDADDAGTPVMPVNGTLGAIKSQDGRIVGGVKNPQAPPLPQPPADYGLTSQEQYDRAFGLLRQANYDDAAQAFKTFIDKNPKDKLIDNAKYWYAETLYVRARFPEAATAFADAYQQNTQGSKAPDCLLKLAMSLAATDKQPDACVALGELRSKYPNASTTVRSRALEEQAKLKCSPS